MCCFIWKLLLLHPDAIHNVNCMYAILWGRLEPFVHVAIATHKKAYRTEQKKGAHHYHKKITFCGCGYCATYALAEKHAPGTDTINSRIISAVTLKSLENCISKSVCMSHSAIQPASQQQAKQQSNKFP